MKTILKNFLVILALGMLSASTSGCFLLLGAAAGAGGFAYVQGDLEKNVDVKIEKAYDATLAALKKLEMFVISDELAQHDATIKSVDADGKDVKISLKALTEKATKISVRVGVFGDEDKSQMIMNAILKKI